MGKVRDIHFVALACHQSSINICKEDESPNLPKMCCALGFVCSVIPILIPLQFGGAKILLFF